MKKGRILLHLVKVFYAICSCSIIGTTVFLTLFSFQNIAVALLRQIIFVAVIATLLEFIFYGKDELGKKQHLIRRVIHFLALNTLLFSAAYFFKWVQFNDLIPLMCFAGIVFVVYVLVCMFSYISDRTQAKALNKKLVEYKRKRGDTEN